MTRNRLGPNYLGVPDVAEEMRHARAAQFGGGLFFQNQIDFARDFKTALPGANVVIRNWPDRTLPKSVDDWLAKNRHLSEGGLIVQTVNELGFTAENIDFHTQLLEKLKRDKINMLVGILAMSVGNPGPDDWPRAEKLLRLAADMRDKVHLILHEYYGGVITSGFHGGNPTMIQPETWPTDTSNITLWHVGRYRFLKKTCKLLGIPLPRIIIGEFGADFTGDIGKWLTTLKSTKGQYDIVDGWRDLVDQWRMWWPEWDGATAYMKQFAYADQYIYLDEEVESILFFTRWNDGSWGTYQTNPEMDKQMEAYRSQARLDTLPETPPEMPPAPAVTWIMATAKLKLNVEHANLHADPSLSSKDLGDIHGYDPIEYDSTGVKNGWWHVRYFETEGWVAATYFEPVIDEPPPRLPFVPVPSFIDGAQAVTIQGQIAYVLQAIASNDRLQKVGLLTDGEQVTLYRSTYTVENGLTWYWTVRSSTPLGESNVGWIAYNLPTPPPEPLRQYVIKVVITATDEQTAQIAAAAVSLFDFMATFSDAWKSVKPHIVIEDMSQVRQGVTG